MSIAKTKRHRPGRQTEHQCHATGTFDYCRSGRNHRRRRNSKAIKHRNEFADVPELSHRTAKVHVLMTGQLAGKKEDYAELQPEENKYIRNAIAEGVVRDIFVKTDQTGIVMIHSDVTADEAREKMASLPFIVHGAATFEYIEIADPSAGVLDLPG
jgi:hypothetical protein